MPASFRITSLGVAQFCSAVSSNTPVTCDANRQLARQLDAEHLGGLELPRQASHDIDGVRTANTNASDD